MIDIDNVDSFNDYALQNRWAVLFPLQLGATLDIFVLGIVFSQLVYWKIYLEKQDRWQLRLFIYYMAIASLGHSTYCQMFSTHVFISGYGNPHAILEGWWAKAEILCTVCIELPIEGYYAIRAYSLWDRPSSLKYSLIISYFSFVGVAIACICVGQSDFFSVITSPLFIAFATMLMVFDWTLSGLIVIGLLKKRSGMARSDRLVMRIVVLSAEAQLLPSVVTVAVLLKALISPYDFFLYIGLVTPKFWVLTTMLLINSRKGMREEMEATRNIHQNTLNAYSENIDTSRLYSDKHNISTPSVYPPNEGVEFLNHPSIHINTDLEKLGEKYCDTRSSKDISLKVKQDIAVIEGIGSYRRPSLISFSSMLKCPTISQLTSPELGCSTGTIPYEGKEVENQNIARGTRNLLGSTWRQFSRRGSESKGISRNNGGPSSKAQGGEEEESAMRDLSFEEMLAHR